MNSDNLRTSRLCAFVANKSTAVAQMNIHTGQKTNKTKIRNLKFPFLYFPFLYFLLTLNCQLSIIHYFLRPHLIIGAPDLRSERAVRQKTSCLSRRKAASYLSFSEQAAVGSMRRCSLDFFCILFCIKAKKYVGFGAKPQESMDNAQCIISRFDNSLKFLFLYFPFLYFLLILNS